MKPRMALGGLLVVLAAVILAACNGSTSRAGGLATPTGQTQAKNVQVTLYDNRMEFSHTTFSAGTPYHFVMTNKGTLQQECMITPSGMGQMPMENMRQRAMMTTNGMMPGTTGTVDYIFPAGMAPQQLQFNCFSNGRATMSMPIQVK